MNGFIKNPIILEEGYKVDDLLDFSNEVGRLNRTIQRIPYSSLVGYVGKFGSGKSTALFQLQKEYAEDKNSKWFEFDAWKYPERKDLWEGFVIDIADQLGNKTNTAKKIDGKTNTGKAVGAIAKIAQAIGIAPALSFVIEKFSYLFEGQPIERVFEIQELLKSFFSTLKEENIFIIVEDLDRSGDAGRFFLETLRQFVKNNLPEKRIIILVPIGTEVYDNAVDHRASYQKVLDYILFFSPRGISFSNFIDEVFEPTAFPSEMEVRANEKRKTPWKEQLIDWFAIATSHKLTIREIKVALRFANISYLDLREQGYEADPRIVLAFTLLNHIFSEGGSRLITTIEKENPIGHNSPISKLLQAIARNNDIKTYEGDGWIPAKIKLVEDNSFVIPKHRTARIAGTSNREEVYYLSDLYLIPFGKKYANKINE